MKRRFFLAAASLLACASVLVQQAEAMPFPALPPEPPSDPFMLATAGRVLTPTGVTPSVSASTYQAGAITFPGVPYPQYNLKIVMPGFYTPNGGLEVPVGNDQPLQGMTVQIGGVGGPIYPLTFGGGATGGVIPNGGWLENDENNIQIPANTPIRIMWAMGPFAVGQNYLNAQYAMQTTNGDGSSSNSAISKLPLIYSGAFSAQGYNAGSIMGPMLILAKGWAAAGKPPAPLLAGDSVLTGYGGQQGILAPDGIFGYVARGLYDNQTSTRMAHLNWGTFGTDYSTFCDTNSVQGRLTQGGWVLRKKILAHFNWPFTSIICEMGLNTSANPVPYPPGASANTAAYQAFCVQQAQAAWAFLASMGNKPIIQCCLTPQSASQNDNNSGGTYPTSSGPGATNYYYWANSNPVYQFPTQFNLWTLNQLYTGNWSVLPSQIRGIIDPRPYLYLSGSTVPKWNIGALTTTFAQAVAGPCSGVVGTQTGNTFTVTSGPISGTISIGAIFSASGTTTQTVVGVSGSTLTMSVSQTISSPTAMTVKGANVVYLNAAPQASFATSTSFFSSLVFDAGTGGLAEVAVVESVSGSSAPYTVQLKASVSYAHASGAGVQSVLTPDGTHLYQEAEVMAMPAVIAAKNSGLIV